MNISRPLLHGLLAIGAQLACLAALAQGQVTRDEHAAAQALQQVRLEALKDIQQKEADALRAQLAAVDKRLDDLNTHTGQGVDRLGVYASILGILVTVLLAVLGLLGWITVNRKTKAEAQEAASAWFKDKASALEQRLQEIEEKASQTQKQIDSAAQGARDHSEATINEAQSLQQAMKQMQARMRQMEPSAQATAQSQEAVNLVKQRANKLKKTPEDSYTFDDWNARAHAAHEDQKLEEAAFLWQKAAEAPDATPLDVILSLFNRGIAQGALGQHPAVLTTFTELLHRFGETTDPDLRELVAIAMVNTGVAEGNLGQHETAIATFNEVLRRFGEATDPALLEWVGKAMVNRGNAEGRLGQREKAIGTFNEVLRRFGDTTDPALREVVSIAINGIAFQQICDGKALWSTDQAGSKTLWRATVEQFDRALALLEPTRLNGITMGNRAYALTLLGQIPDAESEFARALRAPVEGGKALYDGTLSDFDIHPIAEDQPMRELVERQWQIWLDEQGGGSAPAVV